MNWPRRFLIVMQQVAACSVLTYAGFAVAQDAAEKPDLQRGKAIAVQVCAACHGSDGNSAISTYPKLAGQHAEYLYKQLADYKIPSGTSKATRQNPIMAGFAAALSEQDARNVSAYFAAQSPAPGFARSPEKVALGQKIWRGGVAQKSIPACAACHGPAGEGIPAQYPRLAGQPQAYTISQISAFQKGNRNNNVPMQAIVERLSEVEVQAVADYIAGLH